MTSGFDQLERELRAAEARLGAESGAWTGARSPAGLLRTGTALVSAVVAIGVVVAAFALLHSGGRPTGRTGPLGPGMHYSDPEGWSVTYPSGLHLSVAKSGGALQQSQVTITSFTASRFLQGRLRNRTPIVPGQMPFSAPVDRDGRFPADGIAVILQSGSYTVLGADSRFPIALNSFHTRSTTTFLSTTAARRAGLPEARSRTIVAYSEPVTATVLIGARVPAALQGEAAGVIASLAFRALEAGTPVATGVLLGPGRDYSVGSFTRVHVRFPAHRRQAIYIVHAPGRFTYGHECGVAAPCAPAGAFYAIGGSYNTRRNHAPDCAIQFDARARAFYCRNLGVRWDRVGRVVSRPRDESDIGSNAGLYAKVCWDGQLMVAPGFGPQLSRAAVHELWPGWHQPNEPLSR